MTILWLPGAVGYRRNSHNISWFQPIADWPGARFRPLESSRGGPVRSRTAVLEDRHGVPGRG